MRNTLLPFALVVASATQANAVGFATQINCAGDYYALCSQHSIGSPELRRCMRVNGPRLSKGCINALISDGEISKEDVERERAKLLAVKQKPKPIESTSEAESKQTAAGGKADSKSASVAMKVVKPANAAKPLPPKQLVAKAEPVPPTVKMKPQAIVAAAAPVRSVAQPLGAAASIASGEAKPPALALDDLTYAALKTRGTQFVAEADPVTEAIETARQLLAEPAEAKPIEVRAALKPPVTRTASNVTTIAKRKPKAEESEPADVSVAPVWLAERQAQETVAEAPEAVAPRSYPAGRMSLGSAEQNDRPSTSWWDDLVQKLTGK